MEAIITFWLMRLPEVERTSGLKKSSIYDRVKKVLFLLLFAWDPNQLLGEVTRLGSGLIRDLVWALDEHPYERYCN